MQLGTFRVNVRGAKHLRFVRRTGGPAKTPCPLAFRRGVAEKSAYRALSGLIDSVAPGGSRRFPHGDSNAWDSFQHPRKTPSK